MRVIANYINGDSGEPMSWASGDTIDIEQPIPKTITTRQEKSMSKDIQELKAGDIVQIIDIGVGYSSDDRRMYIGQYARILEVQEYFPNYWYRAKIGLIQRLGHTREFSRVRLRKAIGGVIKKGEEVGDTDKIK